MIKELIISLVILAGSITLYCTLGWLEDPRAATFPRIIILIMGALAVALLIQSILMKGKKEKVILQQTSVAAKGSSAAGASFPFGTVVTCFLLIIAYFAVMQWLGFYVSAFLYFCASIMILGRKDLTVRKGASRIMSALIFVAILYILFKIILVVQTPKGLFI